MVSEKLPTRWTSLFAMAFGIDPVNEQRPTRQALPNSMMRRLSLHLYPHLYLHLYIVSCALTAELCCPFRAPLNVVLTDSWPCTFHRFHEVLQCERRLKQLVRVHLSPRHFNRPSVPGRARRQFLFAGNGDLMCPRKLCSPYNRS